MRGMEGQVWEMRRIGEGTELHLVVIDDGRTLKASGERMVIILDLETGELDYELVRHLERGFEAGWERLA